MSPSDCVSCGKSNSHKRYTCFNCGHKLKDYRAIKPPKITKEPYERQWITRVQV